MTRRFIQTGAALAGISVALGALGSHFVRGRAEPYQYDNWQTAATYLMMHSLALIACGAIYKSYNKGVPWGSIYWLFTAGAVLFSGALFCTALQKILNMDLKGLGVIAPVGGVCLILGWAVLAISISTVASTGYIPSAKRSGSRPSSKD